MENYTTATQCKPNLLVGVGSVSGNVSDTWVRSSEIAGYMFQSGFGIGSGEGELDRASPSPRAAQ